MFDLHAQAVGAALGPDFVVIGAMKAGTTALHHRLAAHPEIAMPRAKETDFFLKPDGDLAWYRRQFPPGRIRGEAAPNYARCGVFPGVADRIHAANPDCRIVYLLRDPVARVASEYRHKRAAGRITEDGERSLDNPAVWEKLLEASRYAHQLRPYLDRFSPERILLIRFERLVAQPDAELARLAAFLGVADRWPTPVAYANAAADVAGLPRWYWAVRTLRPARWLRAQLPEPAVSAIRRWAGRANPAPEIPAPWRAKATAALAGEEAALKTLMANARLETRAPHGSFPSERPPIDPSMRKTQAAFG